MKKVHELMQKEMTRGEFLATVGFGVATLFGLSTLIKFLTGKENPLQQNGKALGYGSGAYGGERKS